MSAKQQRLAGKVLLLGNACITFPEIVRITHAAHAAKAHTPGHSVFTRPSRLRLCRRAVFLTPSATYHRGSRTSPVLQGGARIAAPPVSAVAQLPQPDHRDDCVHHQAADECAKLPTSWCVAVLYVHMASPQTIEHIASLQPFRPHQAGMPLSAHCPHHRTSRTLALRLSGVPTAEKLHIALVGFISIGPEQTLPIAFPLGPSGRTHKTSPRASDRGGVRERVRPPGLSVSPVPHTIAGTGPARPDPLIAHTAPRRRSSLPPSPAYYYKHVQAVKRPTFARNICQIAVNRKGTSQLAGR
ncbi:hypothetical protein B0H15DRAFT_954715 [Mycena belliarum]|uniref:Uncharacterized protein n=1 Tax=Mycena belliarum TaxID=1033014 RepID=A0AAD6TVU6_9AGAR|nr:hypothetical protein B0H15DRAFT_954715 [Mycena belliae]